MRCYDASGEILCFVEDNILSLFQEEEIIKGCSFEHMIIDVKASTKPGTFYIKIGDENEYKYIEVNAEYKNYLSLSESIKVEVESNE